MKKKEEEQTMDHAEYVPHPDGEGDMLCFCMIPFISSPRGYESAGRGIKDMKGRWSILSIALFEK
ncbi:hypothetical protein ACEQPO_10485 [Bacillus sp. SL00103]